MSTQQNKAAARRFFEEGWNRRNFAVFDELLAPDSVHHIVQAAFHPSRPGPEGYGERAARVLGAFPDYRVTIEDMIAEADMVVVRYTAAGTHLGPFQGVTPTGKRFVYQGIEIHRYTDGKVVERWNSHDALGLFQQLGIMPPLQHSPTRPESEPR